MQKYMQNLLDFIRRVRDEIISELEEIELICTKMIRLTQAQERSFEKLTALKLNPVHYIRI